LALDSVVMSRIDKLATDVISSRSYTVYCVSCVAIYSCLCYCVVLYIEGEEIMNLVSMDKRYKTRDGRDVRVLCVDNVTAHGVYPVVAVIGGAPSMFTATGRDVDDYHETEDDLIEQPEYKELWTEIFTVGNSDVRVVYYLSETALQIGVASNRGFYANNYKLIAIKKITYVEGGGVE
jgi:hypothetical protein